MDSINRNMTATMQDRKENFRPPQEIHVMRPTCISPISAPGDEFDEIESDGDGQRSMQPKSKFLRASSCHDVYSSARPSRAPPRRGAPPRQSKDESALLKCLARAASERSFYDEPASSLSRQYQSSRHLGRTRSRLHVTKKDTADDAKLYLSSHFPSLAICLQSGHGGTDEDISPRRPMLSRQYQSARHLGRTQSQLHVTKNDTADEAKLSLSSHFPSVQSGHGDTDEDISFRRPMLSRQHQSARHVGRLHVTKNDTADETKLYLSSQFPSVAICLQSGHRDTKEDISPRRPMLSRQYQSARHLGRTQSRLHVTKVETADESKLYLSSHFTSVQSGHVDTDEDISFRRPMLSRQHQSARHVGRLHVNNDDTADEAKLSLSSNFPSVSICMQSGHGDIDVKPELKDAIVVSGITMHQVQQEDLSPMRPIRTKSPFVCNSKQSPIYALRAPHFVLQ
jgi:hypothetical protein